MKACRSCKHWNPPETLGGAIPELGRCMAVVQYWDATEWDDDGIRSLKQEYVGRLAFVSDGSDYYAELNTLPDFGCLQHEDSAPGNYEERTDK